MTHPPKRAATSRRVGIILAALAILVVLVAVFVRPSEPDATPAQIPAPAAGGPVAAPPPPQRRRVPAPREPVAVETAREPEPVVETVPEPPSRDVSGVVVDPDGAPIEGATVALFGADERPLGSTETDAAGAFRLADAADAAVLLVARRLPLATTFVDLTPPTADEPATPVRVQMDRGAAIEGEVRLVSGGTPRVAVHVLVRPWTWTAGTRGGRGLDVERQAAEGDPRLFTAEMEVDGGFRVEGLVVDRDYLVHAGGEGLGLATVNMVSVVRARAGGDAVIVWLTPLYVLDVRVVGADGESLERLPNGVRISGVGPVSFSGPFLGNHTSNGLWSGVSARKDGASRYRQHVILTAPFEADRIGPYRFSAAASGYRAATHEVWALRAQSGVDASQEIRLERAAEAFGALRIRFDDRESGFVAAMEAYPEQAAMLFSAPQVLLRPVGDAAPGVTSLFIDGRAFAAGGEVIDIPLLPCAEYDAHLRLPFGAAESRNWKQRVTIEADATAELLVPVPEWAALELHVSEGAPAELGLVEVRVLRPGSTGFKSWHFLGPPYRVVGMAPGTYDVEIHCRGLDTTALTVDLLPDRVTPVEWEVVVAEDR